MAINFPDSPVNGSTYDYQGIRYTYVVTGSTGYWRVITAGNTGSATVAEIDAGLIDNKYATPLNLEGSKYEAGLHADGVSYDNSDGALDATAATVQAAIRAVLDERPNPNLIINGGFQVWQRGTTFSAGNEYTADRWRTNLQNNASRVTTNINAEATYGLNISNNGTAPSINQPVELDVTGNAGVFQSGRDFTLSLTLRANVAGTIQVRGLFRDISNNSLNQVVCTNLLTLNVTTGVQQFSDVLTINATPNPTNVMMELVIYTTGGIDDFTISQVKLERGGVATRFEYEPYGDVLRKCQRYYWEVNKNLIMYRSSNDDTKRRYYAPFPVTMRTNPNVIVTTNNGTPNYDSNKDALGIFLDDAPVAETAITTLKAEAEL